MFLLFLLVPNVFVIVGSDGFPLVEPILAQPISTTLEITNNRKIQQYGQAIDRMI
jgi:hypothetical protein